MEGFRYQPTGVLFEHKDKIKKTPPPSKSTGEHKDKRPKVRGSIFKRILPVPRR